MRLTFVHGWSVTNTDTYGELPAALSAVASRYGLELRIEHLYLGKYVSFHDAVTLDDIARALNRALRDRPDSDGEWKEYFRNSEIAEFPCFLSGFQIEDTVCLNLRRS